MNFPVHGHSSVDWESSLDWKNDFHLYYVSTQGYSISDPEGVEWKISKTLFSPTPTSHIFWENHPPPRKYLIFCGPPLPTYFIFAVDPSPQIFIFGFPLYPLIRMVGGRVHCPLKHIICRSIRISVRDWSLFMTRGNGFKLPFYGKYFRGLLGVRRKYFATYSTQREKFSMPTLIGRKAHVLTTEQNEWQCKLCAGFLVQVNG